MLKDLGDIINNDSSVTLSNYQTLLNKVDDLCRQISDTFGEKIVCTPGCSGCCKDLTLFPVEAFALAQAITDLPEAVQKIVHKTSTAALEDGRCPLLQDNVCVVYLARPIICRTHGMPLLIQLEGEKRLDFCPKNFLGVDSFPGQAIINLELMNSSLAAINTLFLKETGLKLPVDTERVTISNIILSLIGQTI